MSTNLHFDPTRAGLLSSNTIANSIRTEQRDRRLEPADLRTRRFGYNPGYIMTQDPVVSGLQQTLVPPGCLILFETAPVRRQNWSVDPEDNSEPDKEVDLLAGEGFHSVNVLYAPMGWREMLPLRGLPDERAVDLFYTVHPPLSECHEAGMIPECPYQLEVCITCRQTALSKILRPPTSVVELLAVLRESVSVGRAYMAAEWHRWVGEYAGATINNGQDRPGIRELGEGHLYFMRQLHERSPKEHELAKIAMQGDRQAAIMKETISELTTQMSQIMASQQQKPQVDPTIASQMAQMQSQIAALQVELAKSRGTDAVPNLDEPVHSEPQPEVSPDSSSTEE